MVLPGHLSGGYLATQSLLALTHASLPPTQAAIVSVIGTIFGDGPDIDLFIYYLNQKSSHPTTDENGHRSYITHTPMFWLAVSLPIVVAGLLAGSLFVQFIGWAVLVGSWSHLLLDSIEFGIRWLWPFTNRRFCLREVVEPQIGGVKGSLSYYKELVMKTAFKNVTFYLEIIITIIALWVAFR